MIAVLYTLITTHITIICVTLYLHRGMAHRGIVFNSAVEHFMRFWLWLTTGMITREWVAIHRKHHQQCDLQGDPHSPVVYGIWRVLFGGVQLYYRAGLDRAMIDAYSKDIKLDWIERHVYSKYSSLGIILLLAIDVLLFGWWGFLVWGVQMIWIPFWAAGVVNGIGHWWGYRNHATQDQSRNIVPFGIIIGGEELHNNHHNKASSVKLSNRWWEFDIGWMWLGVLRFLRLAKLKT